MLMQQKINNIFQMHKSIQGREWLAPTKYSIVNTKTNLNATYNLKVYVKTNKYGSECEKVYWMTLHLSWMKWLEI